MIPKKYFLFDPKNRKILCPEHFDVDHLAELKFEFNRLQFPSSGELVISGKEVKKMDTAGAWLLTEWKRKLEAQHLEVKLQDFSEQYLKLISLVERTVAKKNEEKKAISPTEQIGRLKEFGKISSDQVKGFFQFLSFVGLLTFEAIRIIGNPKHIRLPALTTVVYRNGYLALPIIAILSFMIGVVITYQMGLQLRSYGANIYIVDLLGLAILREFGPLLTSIMIAGRTGSAFTAQLGIMKINQEIDALDTMGVTPSELLLLPRIAGLVIALPLLTIWSDFFGILGGMMMSHSMLNIGWYDFLHRFPNVVKLRSLIIGLGKAPVFALIIATIACFEGMQVERNADSLGRNTTRSVVLAIFFIIVADAIFSVVFSKLKL